MKCIKIYLETPKGIGHLEGLDVDRKIILKWIGKECESSM